MPKDNRFRHQSYPTAVDPQLQPVVVKLKHPAPSEPGCAAELHTKFRIRDVVLVHGTFVGEDPFGLSAALRAASKIPGVGSKLAEIADSLNDRTKDTTDATLKDVANYTAIYRDRLQTLVGTDPRVQLLEPGWSSQNHHLARADLAVRLLCLLDDFGHDVEHERVLLWGHSHAGQGFALLSNLLANEPESVARFFDTGGAEVGPHWKRGREILAAVKGPHPLAKLLVLVTFGTPVRYGWDTQGYRYLLHVSHHVPRDPEHPSAAVPLWPMPDAEDIVKAKFGDWVQMGGIAGTDLPSIMRADATRKLGEQFEAGLDSSVSRRFLPEISKLVDRWKTGTRCHADGRNLLVSYEPCGREWLKRPIEESVLGHGVLTTTDWLPRHLQLVLEWFAADGL